MGNQQRKRSTLSREEVQDLLSRSRFNADRILELHRQFLRDHPTGNITLTEFIEAYKRQFPNADLTLCERLFRAYDVDNSGEVSFSEFLIGLDVAQNGTTDDRLRWAFRVYDIDNDGSISSKELVTILKAMYDIQKIANSETQAKKNAKIIMDKLDENNDGKLSADEFFQACTTHPFIVSLIDGRRH